MESDDPMKSFLEEPKDVNEIRIDEPTSLVSKDWVRDPDVHDMKSFVERSSYWGDSFTEMKMEIDPSLPDSVNPADAKFVFRFKELLKTVKIMMHIGQRKHFVVAVDKTLTNWFRKLFVSMHKLFGVDALLSLGRDFDGEFSVREFCFRCFITIRNLSQGDIERDGDLLPADPERMIWYMAPVKAWMALVLEGVVELDVSLHYIRKHKINLSNNNYICMQDLELSKYPGQAEPIAGAVAPSIAGDTAPSLAGAAAPAVAGAATHSFTGTAAHSLAGAAAQSDSIPGAAAAPSLSGTATPSLTGAATPSLACAQPADHSLAGAVVPFLPDAAAPSLADAAVSSLAGDATPSLSGDAAPSLPGAAAHSLAGAAAGPPSLPDAAATSLAGAAAAPSLAGPGAVSPSLPGAAAQSLPSSGAAVPPLAGAASTSVAGAVAPSLEVTPNRISPFTLTTITLVKNLIFRINGRALR